MKIQIWSDVYCPFCYIGEKTLEKALEKYPQAKDIEIEYKSFELDPHSDFSEGLSMTEYIGKKYNMSLDQVRKNNEGIKERGIEVGIDFDFEKLVLVNTFDAHRVIQFAKTKKQDKIMAERLFKAMFTEGADLSNYDVLADLSEEVGLDRAEVRAMLDTAEFGENVRVDERKGSLIGVRSVPFFLFDEKIALNGAHHVSAFEDVIEKAFDIKPAIEIIAEDGGMCGENGCSIK